MENPNCFVDLRWNLVDSKNSFDRYYFTYVLTSNRLAPNLTVQLYHYRVCCLPQIEGKSSSNFSHYSKKRALLLKCNFVKSAHFFYIQEESSFLFLHTLSYHQWGSSFKCRTARWRYIGTEKLEDIFRPAIEFYNASS